MRRYLFRPEVLVLLLAISAFGAKKLWTEVYSKQNYTCDASGVRAPSSSSSCQVGDTGPGGGIVFFVAATPFACGPTLASGCTYLEVAPSGWSVTLASGCQDFAGSSTSDPRCDWSGGSEDLIGTDTAIGTGYKNTLAIIVAYSNTASAASASQAYEGGGKTDWYLPSKDELIELFSQKTTIGGFVADFYWSSSENRAGDAWISSASGMDSAGFKDFYRSVRPVRAFGEVGRPARAFGEVGPVDVSSWQIGDTGPGGGIVFFVAATPFACGPTLASGCTYLEVAPSGWDSSRIWCRDYGGTPKLPDPVCSWSGSGVGVVDTAIGTATAIGTGYYNTLARISALQGQGFITAASASQAYAGGRKRDWYLPSKDELNELFKQKFLVGGICDCGYWSSSEVSATLAWHQFFNGGGQGGFSKDSDNFVRPVRAF